MQRKRKQDFLTFQFDDSPLPIEGFRKGISFLFNSTLYRVLDEPFFDLDKKEVVVTVSYEVLSLY